MNTFSRYLTQQKITRYQIAKATGIYQSTLQRASKATSLDTLSVKILKAVATTLHKTPGQVLDELLALSNTN
ncbi:helix-turn-helix domain-containing protein [Agrilactobacillus fermenti]|uniref:helix-turn-helix domain-containing protein n=1 Tax=Agrilactobacillus fermenti TaxID=2586909 RepID=UPI001E3BF4E6|nr:helix-turn-helix domain-containing protein [Agrilactobacillus fermenti]MCD2257457.1 helix-turn-helix domain-containing protein [Agrilactobacillus fermenti]